MGSPCILGLYVINIFMIYHSSSHLWVAGIWLQPYRLSTGQWWKWARNLLKWRQLAEDSHKLMEVIEVGCRNMIILSSTSSKLICFVHGRGNTMYSHWITIRGTPPKNIRNLKRGHWRVLRCCRLSLVQIPFQYKINHQTDKINWGIYPHISQWFKKKVLVYHWLSAGKKN